MRNWTEVYSSPDYLLLKQALMQATDPETGIISRVYAMSRQMDMPDFFYYKAEIGDSGVLGLPPAGAVAGGTSLSREKAMVKAIGEAIERYSSGIYSPETLKLVQLNQLKPPFSDPLSLQLFDLGENQDTDLKIKPVESKSGVRVVPGERLTDMEPFWVPAGLVYCPYEPGDGEETFFEIISTGLATHVSRIQAEINGILEVVERDAFQLSWLAAGFHRCLLNESLQDSHHDQLETYLSAGYEVQLFDITQDNGIPAISAVMRGTIPGQVPFMVAAAAHYSVSHAITKVLDELALIERYTRRLISDRNSKVYAEDFRDVRFLKDHVAIWLSSEMLRKADALFQALPEISMGELQTETPETPGEILNWLVQRVSDTGYETFSVDCTPEDVAALGWVTRRVVIPGYLPLNKHYHCRPLRSQRLRQKLQQEGKESANPLPHPFA